VAENRFRWYLSSALFLSAALNYLDRQTLSVLASTIQRDLRVDDIAYSQITSCFLISYTIMYGVSGGLINLLGTRRSLAIAVAGWSVVSMLHGFASSAAHLLALRFSLGAFESANYPAGVKVIAERFPVKERAAGIGVFVAGSALGAAFSVPLVSFLALRFGWRAAFVVTGAVGLGWVVLWLATCRRADASAGDGGGDAAEEQPGAPVSWRALLAMKATWGCIVARMLTDPIIYFVSFWIPKFFEKQHGFSLEEVGRYAWIPYVGLSAGNILGGMIPRELVNRGASLNTARKGTMLVASLAILAAAWQASRASSGVDALVAVTCLTLGHGMWGNVAIPAEVFATRYVGPVSGLGGMFGGVAGILTQLLIGLLAERNTYESVFLMFCMFPLLALVAVHLLAGELGVIRDYSPAARTQSSIPVVGVAAATVVRGKE
jgi:ACS family hexuronate transporter-like MFS transporter